MADLESQVKSLESALSAKIAEFNDLSAIKTRIEAELAAHRQLSSATSSDHRQHVQAMIQKDDIISSLESKLADNVKLIHDLNNKIADLQSSSIII